MPIQNDLPQEFAVPEVSAEEQEAYLRAIFGEKANIGVYTHIERAEVAFRLDDTVIHKEAPTGEKIDIQLLAPRGNEHHIDIETIGPVPHSHHLTEMGFSTDEPLLGFKVRHLDITGAGLILMVTETKATMYLVPGAQHSYDFENNIIIVPHLVEAGDLAALIHEIGHSLDKNFDKERYAKSVQALNDRAKAGTVSADDDVAFEAWKYLLEREVAANKEAIKVSAVLEHRMHVGRNGKHIFHKEDAYFGDDEDTEFIEFKKFLSLFLTTYIYGYGEPFPDRLGKQELLDLLNY